MQWCAYSVPIWNGVEWRCTVADKWRWVQAKYKTGANTFSYIPSLLSVLTHCHTVMAHWAIVNVVSDAGALLTMTGQTVWLWKRSDAGFCWIANIKENSVCSFFIFNNSLPRQPRVFSCCISHPELMKKSLMSRLKCVFRHFDWFNLI